MEFKRVLTKDNPDADVKWVKRDAKITDSNGNVIFEQKDVEVPESWSDNALNIVASKYFKKIDGELETSVKSLVARVVNTIIGWGHKNNYFQGPQDAAIFKDELSYLLVNQYACFNSPIWFNFGVPGREQQAAACFLLGLEDDSKSIRNWTSVESTIFKGGSGSGINLSPLRYEGAPLSTGGSASGPMSFAKAADYNAAVWKSGGATRRAATLRRMDVTHKDIEKFITCKVQEEKKAKILIEAGYDGGINGEAYSTVAFQNMNHSVGVTNDFMELVVNGDAEATRLMRLMTQSAWNSGDPGIQYDTTINSWNTIPNSGRITTSNPCGEYLSTDWSSCLLASFNLLKFKKENDFNYKIFEHAVSIFTIALDIIICEADYPDPKFKETAHKQRQLGLGYSNLGALLMSLGLPYASKEGRNLAARITSTMTAQAYLTSTNLAEQLGPFPDYEKNREAMLDIICKHRDAALSLDYGWEWKVLLEQAKKHGLRNATVTLIAPTGTISFMMDCSTTGIEPEFALVKYKSLVGGGMLSLVNSTVIEALENLGYNEEQRTRIVNYLKENGTLETPAYISDFLKEEHYPIFDCAVKPKNGKRFIDYQDHVKMVAAVQPFLSMGISKTINMPYEAVVDDVYDLYIEAWKLGLKSLSIYRDGSKHSQPLNVSNKDVSSTLSTSRRPLAKERKSITHKIEIANLECYLHVGLYPDGSPGELFIQASKLGSTVSGLLDSFAIGVSFALQYGVPLDLLVEKFINTRFEPAGFTKNPEIQITTSIVDYIFRWMELKFLKKEPTAPRTALNGNGNGDGKICRDCGEMMVRSGTCFTCICGNTLGGCG